MLQKHHTETRFQSMCSSCHLPCLPQSENVVLSLPIKLQSTNEDGVRRRITSNILSPTQACLCQPQISFQIKALKMGEAELPDNNQITSCRRLDLFFQLGCNFLLPIDVRTEFGGVFPARASTIRFNQHSEEHKLLGRADESSRCRSLFRLDPRLIMKMFHGQPKQS